MPRQLDRFVFGPHGMASQLTDLERELLKALAKLLAVSQYAIDDSHTRFRIKNKAKRLLKENPLCPATPGAVAPAAAKTD
jgi:hypothetical protein